MGLGVWFSEDLAHVLRGAGEAVSLLAAQRGLHGPADAAYVAGYWAALRTVATSLGLGDCGLRAAASGEGAAWSESARPVRRLPGRPLDGPPAGPRPWEEDR